MTLWFWQEFIKEVPTQEELAGRGGEQVSIADHQRTLPLLTQMSTARPLFRYTFCRAFLTTLDELNDYAGQHEVIAENLTSQIIAELSRYLQDVKTERKTVSQRPARALLSPPPSPIW